MKIKLFSRALGLLAVWLSLSGCDVINPEEPIPGFLYIEPFTLTTDPETEGTNSSKITEGWVFVNGDFLGVYSLPALVPVLVEGQAEVRVEAGVKENGVSLTPDINPFYEPYRITLNVAPTQIDTLRPTTSYVNLTRFGFIEDFEDPDTRVFGDSIIGGQLFARTQSNAFEGQYSGSLLLTKDTPLLELATTANWSGLLDRGVYVYLEVNYRSEAPVIFGIIAPESGNYNRYYDPGFVPKDGWNKIYFNLAPIIFNSQEEEYQLSFQALLPTGQDSARVWMDNIKLVHF